MPFTASVFITAFFRLGGGKKMNSAVYFEQEKIGVLMRRFAVPCILSLLVSSLYNIMTRFLLSRV